MKKFYQEKIMTILNYNKKYLMTINTKLNFFHLFVLNNIDFIKLKIYTSLININNFLNENYKTNMH
jgi:hypothetical protein